jgi:hypothetical protein
MFRHGDNKVEERQTPETLESNECHQHTFLDRSPQPPQSSLRR